MSLVLQQRESTFNDLKLPRLLGQNVARLEQADGMILEQSLGRWFRNPALTLRVEDPTAPAELRSTGRYTNFMDMAALRNDSRANITHWKTRGADQLANLGSERGIEISNAGISLAVTAVIDGKPYAMCCTRAVKDASGRRVWQLMNISGYNDEGKIFSSDGELARGSGEGKAPLSSRGLMLANGMMEAREEILGVNKPGWFALTNVGRGALAREVVGELAILHHNHLRRFGKDDIVLSGAYSELDYDPNLLLKLRFTALPPHVQNVLPSRKVSFDGSLIEGAGLQIFEHTNSAQVIIGAHFEFPVFSSQEERASFSLLHAEDGPGCITGTPGDLLATRLNALGLVFVELDEGGKLTPNVYNFLSGQLVPAVHLGALDKIVLSDAFVMPNESYTQRLGFLNRPNIPFEQYLFENSVNVRPARTQAAARAEDAARSTPPQPSEAEVSVGTGAFLAYNEVRALRSACKANAKAVVLTSGCFDRLHAGHIGYLTEATRLAEEDDGILMIAINSDRLVQQRRGPGVQPLPTRVQQLQRAFPDAVVFAYDEASDAGIIQDLAPDHFVKGGDYKPDSIDPQTRDALALLGIACEFLAHRPGIHSSLLRKREGA